MLYFDDFICYNYLKQAFWTSVILRIAPTAYLYKHPITIMFLEKEDYLEPLCPLKSPNAITPIPTLRIIERLVEYLSLNDYDSAQKHLDYWLKEADANKDMRGKLTLLNEQIGLYRKLGEKQKGLSAVDGALKLCERLAIKNTLTYATTLINCATLYKAFGMPESALPLYSAAREVYEKNLDERDERLGGLYNNMALSLADLKDFDQAEELYFKAVKIMSATPSREGEQAITYLNLADLYTLKLGFLDGEGLIENCLDKAEKLLEADLKKDGNTAYIYQKCAPIFDYYGRFAVAKRLAEKAKQIYERN